MSDAQGAGTLYVVGTPIGNLEDITHRAVRILKEVCLIAAEDTRVTKKLCKRFGIETPLFIFHQHNVKRALPKLIARLSAGEDVALVTDAGTPSVSDPGVELVAAAREAQVAICPIPGPSALTAALSVAGIPGESVRFLGFLPRAGRSRRELIRSWLFDPALLVIYEAPGRIGQTLADLSEELGPRQGVVLRELTKIHEEVSWGTLPELAERFRDGVRGEITLVVAGGDATRMPDISPEDLKKLVRSELDKGRSVREISSGLSSGLGIGRRQIYELAVGVLREMKENA